MESEVELALADVLVAEIDLHLRLEGLKRDLSDSGKPTSNFNARHVFKAIDEKNNKSID